MALSPQIQALLAQRQSQPQQAYQPQQMAQQMPGQLSPASQAAYQQAMQQGQQWGAASAGQQAVGSNRAMQAEIDRIKGLGYDIQSTQLGPTGYNVSYLGNHDTVAADYARRGVMSPNARWRQRQGMPTAQDRKQQGRAQQQQQLYVAPPNVMGPDISTTYGLPNPDAPAPPSLNSAPQRQMGQAMSPYQQPSANSMYGQKRSYLDPVKQQGWSLNR